MAKQERIIRTYANTVAAASSTTTRDNILVSVQSPRILAGLKFHQNLAWSNATTTGDVTGTSLQMVESLDISINGETSHFRMGTAGHVAAQADDLGHIAAMTALGMGGGTSFEQVDPVAGGACNHTLFVPINKMVSGSFNIDFEIRMDALDDYQANESGATTVSDATLYVSAVFTDSADTEIFVGHVAPRLTDVSANSRYTESFTWANDQSVKGALICVMNDGSTAYGGSDALAQVTVRDTAGNEYGRARGREILNSQWMGVAPRWNATNGATSTEYGSHVLGYYWVDLGLLRGGGVDIEFEAGSAAIDVVTYLVTTRPVSRASGPTLTQAAKSTSAVLDE